MISKNYTHEVGLNSNAPQIPRSIGMAIGVALFIVLIAGFALLTPKTPERMTVAATESAQH